MCNIFHLILPLTKSVGYKSLSQDFLGRVKKYLRTPVLEDYM